MPFWCPWSYTCLYVSFSIGSRSYAIAWNVSSCRTVDTGSKPRSIIMSWEWVLPWNNKIKLSLKKLPFLCVNTFLYYLRKQKQIFPKFCHLKESSFQEGRMEKMSFIYVFLQILPFFTEIIGYLLIYWLCISSLIQ